MRFALHIVLFLLLFLAGGTGCHAESPCMPDDMQIEKTHEDGADRLTDLSRPEHKKAEATFDASDNAVRIFASKSQRLLSARYLRLQNDLARLYTLFYCNPLKSSYRKTTYLHGAVHLCVVSCCCFITLKHIIR